MPKNIVIVGGGASGLIAAIYAAQNQAKVTIIEHKDRVGKKILMTGNGKCNLTNMSDFNGKYYSEQLDCVYEILRQYPAEEVRHFFKELGLYTKEKRDGGVYPVSEQATAVLDTLRMECARRQVQILTDCEAVSIQKKPTGGVLAYERLNENHKKCTITYDRLILATGGKASPVAGSDGTGYALAKAIGHTLIKPLPALVQLRCEGDYFKSVSGVRAQANLSLFINDNYVISEEGELQLTDYGISGIPTFQISRYVSKALDQKQTCEVHINFITYLSQTEKTHLRKQRQQISYKTIEEGLSGIVHKKIAALICRCEGIKPVTKLCDISDRQWANCVDRLSDFSVRVKQTNSFEQAQVCCGGVSLAEVTNQLQSKKDKYIYLTGELLDCDGICGGYNLQWAWATGAIAGKHAASF